MTGITTVPFFNPADQNQQASAVDLMRAQMLAQSLQQNAQMPDPNQMAGNVVVPHSPFEYLTRGLSGALAQQQQLKAMQQMMALRAQQVAALTGGTPGSGGGSTGSMVGGVDPYKIALASNLYGPEAGKAIADAMQPTNNMKDAGASGISTPLNYADALAGVTAKYGKPIETQPVPGGPVTLTRPDVFAQQLGGASALPASPAVPSMPMGNTPYGMGGNQLPGAPQGPINPAPVSAQPLPAPNAPNLDPANIGQMNSGAPGMTLPPTSGLPAGAPMPGAGSGVSAPTASPLPPVSSAIPPTNAAPTAVPLNQTASPQQNAVAQAAALAPIDTAKAGATTDMNNALAYKNGLDNKVTEGQSAMRIINAQEDLLKQFHSGTWTTNKAQVAAAAASVGAPDGLVQMIAGGNPGAVQAFDGLASQHALLQLQSLMGGENGSSPRINKTEYQTFRDDLANPDKMQFAIQQINNMQRQMYGDAYNEQQALNKWTAGDPANGIAPQPITQFRTNYSQQMNKAVTSPMTQAQPSLSDLQAEMQRRGLIK